MSEQKETGEMEQGQSTITEENKAVFTQDHLDEKIGSIRAADKASFRKSLEEKDAEIEALRSQSKQATDKDKSKSDHTSALEARVHELEARDKEKDRILGEKEHENLLSSINVRDKDKLSELGFDSKYHKILLDEMHSERKFEGSDHYYTKNKAAVDQSEILNDLVAKYPEFISVNRPRGNKIPNGRYTGRSSESAITRVNNGENQADVLRGIAEAARTKAAATVKSSREANQIIMGNAIPKL